MQDELAQLKPGERIERVAPLPPPQSSQRSYGQQAVGKLLGGAGVEVPGSISSGGSNSTGSSSGLPRQEELSGVWEVLTLDEEGRPFLDR